MVAITEDEIRSRCERIAAIDAATLQLHAGRMADQKLFGDDRIEMYYAPFDYVNERAEVVIVGVTPGPTQLHESYQVIREQFAQGASLESALAAVKARASFKGMREQLGRWLDELGVAERLGAASCVTLFDSDRDLLHTTSAIRYPTFIRARDGSRTNYSGTSPSLLVHPQLRRFLSEVLAPELAQMPSALIIPLGKASLAAQELCSMGALDPGRCVIGLPHPSPASPNRERYFQERKANLLAHLARNSHVADSRRSPVQSVDTAKRDEPAAAGFEATSGSSTRPMSIEISLTQGNLNNNHVYLKDHLDFFPPEAVGGNTRDDEGRRLVVHFDGLAEPVETDIAGGNKLFFRARRPWGEFFRHHSLKAGDKVRIERISRYEYQVQLVRT